jgi:hypothetical protein
MFKIIGKLLAFIAVAIAFVVGMKDDALEPAECRHAHAPEESPLPLLNLGQTRPMTVNTTVSAPGVTHILGQPSNLAPDS